jgi:putative transposase
MFPATACMARSYDRRMQLRYAFRLYPEPGQRAALARAFGCARVVFNDAVRAREDARAAQLPFPTAAQLSKWLITQARHTVERSWLGEVSSVILQQALRDVEAAYRNFFASLKGERKGPGVGAPRFKSRKDARQSIRFTANARWKITGQGRLLLPKIGEVRVKWSRVLPAVPSSVTVILDSAGRYFASFVIDTDPDTDRARWDEPEPGSTIGIDLGLTHFAVLSDGTKIDSPRFLPRAEKKLKKAQRELSRKQKGSKNRAKARLRVARIHAQVADARKEFHHQLSTRLIRENQAVAVEDLAVSGLARTRLAKSVHDAGWTQFVTMLDYKAQRYGRTFVKVGRFEPTSQVCSACGHRDGPKRLDVREWTCPACGTRHDRDVNAAKNVKTAAGLAASACGVPVRPEPVLAQREETGSHGIPAESRAA